MYYIRFCIFPVLLLVSACSELDPDASAVTVDGAPEYRLDILINTGLVTITDPEDPPQTQTGLQTSVTVQLTATLGEITVPVELRLDDLDMLTATSDSMESINLVLPPCGGEEELDCDARPPDIYVGSFPIDNPVQSVVISVERKSPPQLVNPDDWWVPISGSPDPGNSGVSDLSVFHLDAPNTVTQLAQAFTIDAPNYDPMDPEDPEDDIRVTFELGEEVSIEWNPSETGEAMRLQYGSICNNFATQPQQISINDDPIDPEAEDPPTPGVFTTQVDTFLAGQSVSNREHPDGCIIQVVLIREVDEEAHLTPDPALLGESSLVAAFSRTIQIKSIPADSET
jgi:hypothetical protein